MNKKIKFYFIIYGILILGSYFFSTDAFAATLGDKSIFYIDSSYDTLGREKVTATLQKMSNHLYFYIDDTWWEKLSLEERNKIDTAISGLNDEFERKIYPILTSTFGSEWKPGIDNDEHITALVHQMKKDRAGYIRLGDEYPKFAVAMSNEREMVYLNSDYTISSLNKSFLAHEFMHLITFNQKDRIQNVTEEIWLSEARSEYASTLLGYDLAYEGSNLQKRVYEFLKNPSDPITDWQNTSADYGALNVFTQYLVDYYGVKILVDSLHFSKAGIESVNYALSKSGFSEDFLQIFTDWTVTVFVNDCSLGNKYCYKNLNLKSLRVAPISNFLPINSPSSLYASYFTKNWTGNWYKIFGGGGTLTLEFEGGLKGEFRVPYIICDSSDICAVRFLTLDKNQYGKIIINDFNRKYISLTIIPLAYNSSSISEAISFSWKTTVSIESQGEEELINQLLAQIASLEAEIVRLQAAIDAGQGKVSSCAKFENNLYFGLKDSQEVSCLQEFLKSQGPDVYSEGLVTGNFLSLTKTAVIRFQEKYASDILKPLGLARGTGFVGVATREKINQLLDSLSSI